MQTIRFKDPVSSGSVEISKADAPLLPATMPGGFYGFLISTAQEIPVCLDDKRIWLHSNELICLSPEQKLTLDEPHLPFTLVQFSSSLFREFERERLFHDLIFNWRSSFSGKTLSGKNLASLLHLIDSMECEMQQSKIFQPHSIRNLLSLSIIEIARIAEQLGLHLEYATPSYRLYRDFISAVDAEFRKNHQVSYYAEKVFKSPKTITNTFAKLNLPPPSLIIQERIILESKRLLIYTNMPLSEIAAELGFHEPSHFSR